MFEMGKTCIHMAKLLQDSSGSHTRFNIANNNFEHLLELEWRKKKYACSQMLVVNKQN